MSTGYPYATIRLAIAVVAWLAWSSSAVAQTAPGAAPGSDADLAQQLNNPVANLVSVPFQFNWDQPVGPDEDPRFVLNFQPVVPIQISENWNLIARWIMPYLAQPRLGEGAVPTSGLSDIVATAFFSPSKPGALIWGAGPAFVLPTTNDPLLGSGKWGVGPSIVALKLIGPWIFGALFNQIWGVAGDDFTGGAPRGDYNRMLLQPFLAYTTKNALTLSMNMEAAADWEQDDDNTWTAPLNVLVAKLTRFGPLPMSVGAGVGFFTACTRVRAGLAASPGGDAAASSPIGPQEDRDDEGDDPRAAARPAHAGDGRRGVPAGRSAGIGAAQRAGHHPPEAHPPAVDSPGGLEPAR